MKLLEVTIFTGSQQLVDKTKCKYMPIEDDRESPTARRNKIYEKLHEYIPDAVGVLYWKEERRETVSVKDMQYEEINEEVQK